MGASRVAVLVVDDQQPFRKAARALLARTGDFELVGEAASGEEALELAATLRPDFVLMDVKMPGMSGVEATRRLLEAQPNVVVLLCSTYSAADLPADAATCGAQAYVDKGNLVPEVLTQVWGSCQGSAG
jgi:two-component system, NarL family, invasion response regulator UvrY